MLCSKAAPGGKNGGENEGGAVGHVAPAAGVSVALSTASVFPERTADAFEAAARLGYDGIEIMVTMDPVSQDLDVLRRLSDYHGVPVLAVHAPCLLITQRVWGREPWGKLDRAREVAEVNARLAAEIAERGKAEESLAIALDAADMGSWDLDLASGELNRSASHDAVRGVESLRLL